ncbi:general transcription factor 3C polypeptide 1 [Chanos chanos]|uniref:General transcription factor 3C polypeptide 1 n=1 Tax=Chanos chanos TaxID=29144 RepID=A0A6J2VST1_CHACN|nr:general transcription factor 3C polypeptide 1 [Chanos chanos]
MDALEVTADEVALEGLDGITINSLWVRLQIRHPPFTLTLDPQTKEFLWTSLVCNSDITFYVLPTERHPLVLRDRFAEMDPDTGVQVNRTTAAREQDDIYPITVVLEDKNGIQGSCRFYKERKDITGLIRRVDFTPQLTLEQAHKKWGEKLVLVASQVMRYRCLIGPEGNPELKLSDHSYCMLERVGRARWQGEVQRDLHTTFRTDAGRMHYLRQCLDRNGLITLQSHVIRLPSGGNQYSILLLLKRFHVDRRSKYDILMESTSNLLSQLPNRTGIIIKLRDMLRVNEGTFRRVHQYMQAAKMVQIVTIPLQELNPDAGPCKTKKGTDILVRCLKLIRPYGQKEAEDDEDDENDEDGEGRKCTVPYVRDMERDVLTQAYEIVVTAGTKGISQSALRGHLNVGKLEGRMICRILERNNMIKGIMEDVGRQRTTKYISKLFVEQSELNLQFEREQERSHKLRVCEESFAPTQTLPEESELRVCSEENAEEEEEEESDAGEGMKKSKGRSGSKKTRMRVHTPSLLRQKRSTSAQKKTPTPSKLIGPDIREGVENEDLQDNLDASANHPLSENQSEMDKEVVTMVEEVCSQPEELKVAKENSSNKKKGKMCVKSHVTYRNLKRKNLIIEAVRNMRIIESIYMLQKMLLDAEKQEGVSSKICKKSILRIIHSLSREGLLKLYRTTVIQDGVSKQVQFVVHPSVAPDDPLVKSAIEQVRFRLSGSFTAHRVKPEPEGGRECAGGEDKENDQENKKVLHSKIEEKMGIKPLRDFHPSIVPGLGRSLGFQPKMPRLRTVHTFLWYLTHGHPLRTNPPPAAAPAAPQSSDKPLTPPTEDHRHASVEKEGGGEPVAMEISNSDEKFKVYVDEDSWRRYIPPLPVHRDFGSGWALTSDVLISLPLSIYVQIIQISFKVEGLEEYLDHPMKQHYLIRFLPSHMKRQLLHKRKYIFSFHESMQRLCYMGLLQFGPTEKFQEKDQVFVYVKRHATIADTTTCEPHYNLAVETRPFDRRRYTFCSAQDVENYWFDLMCVCLNSPLGVVRGPRNKQNDEEEGEEAEETIDVRRQRQDKLMYTLRGSSEVIDDGVTPGDGQGAGGLDSSFFGHLKRNWIWTSYLLDKPKKSGDSIEGRGTVRLRTLLTKLPLTKTTCTAQSGGVDLRPAPPVVTEEMVRMETEHSSRNEHVRGGKRQKRKRQKKEGVRLPKRRKKVVNVNRRGCHDEVDRRALLKMTKQRVHWTQQEDSLLMLCRVASHILNHKIKRPFVPWQVVRDLMHAEFEFSQDKTSLSVGRRSRYIMRNPQTCLNFKICLAEVYQDKALSDEYLNRSNNYDNPKVCEEEYKEFVSVLRQKFSSSSGSTDLLIPDTKEELFKRYKVYAIGDEPGEGTKDKLTSEEDIHALVLNNLIQSTLALSNSQIKTHRTFQAFHLYNRYRQEVLCQAFQAIQRKGLVNRRRPDKYLGPKKSRALPILPMSYQLSQIYYRRFTWRFPSSLCNEVYDFLKSVQQRAGRDRPNTIWFQREGDRDGEDSTSDREGMTLFPMDASGGSCLTCLSLMSLGFLSVDVSVPPHIVVVDSNLVDNEVVKSLTSELNDEDDGLDCGVKRQIEVKASQASHTNYLLMRGFCVPGAMNIRNLNSNDNIVVNSCTVHVQLRHTDAHTLFTENSSTLSALSMSGPSCLPAWLRRVHQVRGVCEMGSVQRQVRGLGYTPEDVQAVVEMWSSVEKEGQFGLDRTALCRNFSHLEELQTSRTRTLQQYIQDLVDIEELVEVGAQSQRLVCVSHASAWMLVNSAHDRGMQRITRKRDHTPHKTQASPPRKRLTIEALAPDMVSTETPTTERVVEDTREATAAGDFSGKDKCPGDTRVMVVTPAEGVAMETGEARTEEECLADVDTATSERKGAGPESKGAEIDRHKKMDPETEPQETGISQTTDKEEAILSGEQRNDGLCFVARPWRIVDGSLNLPVSKGMLEAVLYHVMMQPGIPEPDLFEHYKGVLQPVALLDLLQVLVELGCVRRRYVLTGRSPSLFSPCDVIQVREEGQVRATEDRTAFYEPTVDCCLRLAPVLPHQPNWNKWAHGPSN